MATAAAKHFKASDKAIGAGLLSAKLPCRFEILQKNPTAIVDGAHNPDKLNFLAKNLEHHLQQITPKKRDRKIHIIFALTTNKKIEDCLAPLKHFNAKIYPTRFLDAARKVTWPTEIATVAKKLKIPTGKFFLDPLDALRAALNSATKDDIVLITGSFYLCSELREIWIPEEYIIKNKTLFK